MTKPDIQICFTVCETEAKNRLDVLLSRKIEGYSRAQIQNWIVLDYVKIDEKICNRANKIVKTGQIISLQAPSPVRTENQAQAIDLDIIFEDAELLVINKPAGWVVHPGAGNACGTIMNALLYHCKGAEQLPRAGIVHRLDKDTSGVMMVAKTASSYQQLTYALAQRTVHRHYLAIVDGVLKQSQTITTEMGRHPVARTKMAVVRHGKQATTHICVQQYLQAYTLVEATLDTGRTHQIRVHMQHIGHPILGDATYGSHRGYRTLTPEIAAVVCAMPRQALHAYKLELLHPASQTPLSFSCPVPQDMQRLITILAK